MISFQYVFHNVLNIFNNIICFDYDADPDSANSSEDKNDGEGIDFEIDIISVDNVDTEWKKM